MLVKEGVDVFEHVSQRERSGKRGVGDLASGDVVLEHERLLTGALFEHQTHIEIAVAVDQLRGDARILTLENVAHIDVLRAAVVCAGDGHIAQLGLVGHRFHPVGAGDVCCHGWRRGDPGKDGEHHADEQRAEPEAVFGDLHKKILPRYFSPHAHAARRSCAASIAQNPRVGNEKSNRRAYAPVRGCRKCANAVVY